jgi:hypothetical protein
MFKKIGLGIVVLLLAAIAFVWVKLLMPLQASADRNGPDTAARHLSASAQPQHESVLG